MGAKNPDNSQEAVILRELTDREEAFCQRYVMTGRTGDAAEYAGYPTGKQAYVTAHRLLKRARIIARVNQLKRAREEGMTEALRTVEHDRIVEGIVHKRDRVLDKLERIAQAAYEEKQYGHAIRAIELIGKDAAMWIPTQVNVNANLNSNTSALDALPVEHMQALLAAVRGIRAASSGHGAASSVPSLPQAVEQRVIDVDPDDAEDDA